LIFKQNYKIQAISYGKVAKPHYFFLKF